MLLENTIKRNALFWEKVNRVDDLDSCWPWGGATNENGYGIITATVEGKQHFFYTHRVSWEWENNTDIPEGLVIRHTCDNPPCVRPSHLRVGTHKDNTNDKMERGRYVCGVGQISELDVVRIRIKKSQGADTLSLCNEFGLSPQHVNSICRGVYWPNAEGPLTRRFKLTDEMICSVLADLKTMTILQCAEKYNISIGSVQNISQGRRTPSSMSYSAIENSKGVDNEKAVFPVFPSI